MPGAWVTEKPLGQEFIAVTEVNKFLKGISHAKAHVNLVEDKPGSVAVTPPVGREVKLPSGTMLRLVRTRKEQQKQC